MLRKSDVVRKLRNIHSQMRLTLLGAKISEAEVDLFVNSTDKRTVEEIEEYIKWLEEFRSIEDGVYRGFVRYYGLKDHEWWANMELMGSTSGPEFQLCAQKSKPLRKEWRKKHASQNKAK